MSSFAGSPLYFSPSLLNDKALDLTCSWWAGLRNKEVGSGCTGSQATSLDEGKGSQARAYRKGCFGTRGCQWMCRPSFKFKMRIQYQSHSSLVN